MAKLIKWKTLSSRVVQDNHLATKLLSANESGTRYKFSQLYDESRCCKYYLASDIGICYGILCPTSTSSPRSNLRAKLLLKAYNADSNGDRNSEAADSEGAPRSESGNNDSQLEALESYFGKLSPGKVLKPSPRMSSGSLGTIPQNMNQKDEQQLFKSNTETSQLNDSYNSKARLSLLDDYFKKLRKDMKSSSFMVERAEEIEELQRTNYSTWKLNGRKDVTSETGSSRNSGDKIDMRDYFLFDEETSMNLYADDETSDFCLINLLAAINIAILLFEVASPIRDSGFENISIPLMYGAKINKLILVGEWWRLLTPMCLHSGFLHVALGCWVLLTFGPRVCRAYGQLTFFLIYVLGGVCGNLTSFVHTPELTVCGTGPIFGLIGAWLVYQIQNKEVISKDITESMFKKAVTATALSFILSSFGRIDNWTHLGATISGLVFGYFTCPTVEVENAAAKDGQKKAVALIQRQANPCKSVAFFLVSIALLASFVFAYGMQLQILEESE